MKKWLETDSFEEAFEKYNENVDEIDNTFALKANKQQEAWITPTFLNGASGSLQYRRNQFGDIQFRGSITVVNSGVDQFVMPSGYRTYNTSNFPVYNSVGGATYGRFYATGGMRFYYVGVIDLNGVSYDGN